MRDSHQWGLIAQNETTEWAYCDLCRKYRRCEQGKPAVYCTLASIPKEAYL